jgi:hypothetical protein
MGDDVDRAFTERADQSCSKTKKRTIRWMLLLLVFTVFFTTILRYEISLSASVYASDMQVRDDSFQKPVIKSNEESDVIGVASFFEQSHFVYGQKSYAYRYSPKLIAEMKQEIERHRQQQQKLQLPVLFFGVCANPKKRRQRQAIRESWAQDAVVLFMVAGDWDEVAEEFQQQGDLLWIDGPEHYRNGLTPKSLGFLHFASTQVYQRHHLPFDYIFKTDDDVYVNVTHTGLELLAKQHKQNPAQYYGLVHTRAKPSREKTGPWRKFYLSPEDYPDDFFPDYAAGVGYALSRNFTNCAAENIKTMIEMPWEDVATGLLAAKCKVPVTSAADNWKHFVENNEAKLFNFPYRDFKDGGGHVKILHRVPPHYFLPLYKQESLVMAKKLEKNRQR